MNTVQLRRGAYHDSVTLMRISQGLTALPGVEVALVAMATELNLGLARDLGLDIPAQATPADLLVAVRALDADALAAAMAELDERLARTPAAADGPGMRTAPRTTRSALRSGEATMVLVSVPGSHAFAEAMDAIEAGRSVMIFSDNVPVEQEILLKDRAAERGVLVMGPDCGTALVGGVGFGFANVVRPGPVGLVAASGTGAQQLSCLLDLAGVGVSGIIGTGGRDTGDAVGGRSTLRALAMLDDDPATELIALVSKPPSPRVERALRAAGERLRTPVVHAICGRTDLTSAAAEILTALGRTVPVWPCWTAPQTPRAGTLHGLFAGGTLCEEARLIAQGCGLGDSVFVDFGDDALTRGRAHPMIDPGLRLERIAAAAADPACAVVLLDVVLGHAADPDPAAALVPVLRRATQPAVVSLIGTRGDPQNLEAQAAALHAAGAAVFTSNAEAARHAAGLILGDR
ncbi:FdrA family protein [Rhizohabitans arisaemae]|uniref:FdrA family protein n=1 Tax=Rhizohabitans arisaemae TaxID=2720610 RepID=UPI0024B281E4|nr:FdrA family protein [Rhizohabitans arisaemae]